MLEPEPQSPSSWPRRRRRLLCGLGWAGIVAAGLAQVARFVTWDWRPTILLAPFAPYLGLAAAVALVVLFIRRSRVGVLCALALVVAVAIEQAPLFRAGPDRAAATAPRLRVLQANLRVGSADPVRLVERVRTDQIDVLTADELTPAELDRLTSAGLNRSLPYQFVRTGPGGAGTGVWSRFPLTASVAHDDFEFELLSVRVLINRSVPVQLLAVHLLPPWPHRSSIWSDEIGRLRSMLDRARAESGPIIVSGDFNATMDHPQFRRLLTGGLRDAAERAGSGWDPTYPTDRWFGPVLTLDHVLIRGADTRSVHSIALPGSDHRGLVVELRLQP